MKPVTHLLSLSLVAALAAPAAAQMYERDRDHRRGPVAERFQPAPVVTSYSPKAGPPGTIVTVRGHGFARGTKIVYDGAPVAERGRALTQAERRARSTKRLEQRWERSFLRDGRVRAELALHSQRSARLKRMLTLAAARRDPSLRIRIQAALNRENARHQRQMRLLRAGFPRA